jgi:hypothetical protein
MVLLVKQVHLQNEGGAGRGVSFGIEGSRETYRLRGLLIGG